MSQRITLTERELLSILYVCVSYIDMMSRSEDFGDYIKYKLDTGLGSALKKLYRGRNGYTVFQNYKSHRDTYEYPDYEQWLEGRMEDEE